MCVSVRVCVYLCTCGVVGSCICVIVRVCVFVCALEVFRVYVDVVRVCAYPCFLSVHVGL